MSDLIQENYQLAARNVVLRTVIEEVVQQCERTGRPIPGDDTGILLDRLRAALRGEPLPVEPDLS